MLSNLLSSPIIRGHLRSTPSSNFNTTSDPSEPSIPANRRNLWFVRSLWIGRPERIRQRHGLPFTVAPGLIAWAGHHRSQM